MKNRIIGTILGLIAGIIDVIPMIIMDLTWDANLSAFTMWIVIGFFISSVNIKINGIIKGIVIAFLVLLPVSFIIAWQEPGSLIPIAIMTTILGGLLGFAIDRIANKKTKS